MKKVSHISIIKAVSNTLDNKHRLNYEVGSIIPDLLPSFIYKRHTIDNTINILIKEINKIYKHYNKVEHIDSYIARHIGIVSHYIADYFTYPHNKGFKRSLVYHNKWETDLKVYIKSNIDTVIKHNFKGNNLKNIKDIIQFIQAKNKEYNEKEHTIDNDFNYIVEVSISVMYGIIESLKTEGQCEMATA